MFHPFNKRSLLGTIIIIVCRLGWKWKLICSSCNDKCIKSSMVSLCMTEGLPLVVKVLLRNCKDKNRFVFVSDLNRSWKNLDCRCMTAVVFTCLFQNKDIRTLTCSSTCSSCSPSSALCTRWSGICVWTGVCLIVEPEKTPSSEKKLFTHTR